MNFQVCISLNTSSEQHARLCALRVVFAQVCNELAPHVQKSRVWNRVALHHLHYRSLREKFPALGSQMVCNAIYSVSRTGRLIFQTPGSPFHVAKMVGRPMPLLRFADTCPVYFDRHTLSLKDGQCHQRLNGTDLGGSVGCLQARRFINEQDDVGWLVAVIGTNYEPGLRNEEQRGQQDYQPSRSS
jgi:hypothetical protein